MDGNTRPLELIWLTYLWKVRIFAEWISRSHLDRECLEHFGKGDYNSQNQFDDYTKPVNSVVEGVGLSAK
ncbi:hypothetical protein TNCV_3078661 [Trichonephila clavipes]|nr:hypothetical protein TNCV_3078661 [Trichonephila clavipes]